jgi:hypothetical protein
MRSAWTRRRSGSKATPSSRMQARTNEHCPIACTNMPLDCHCTHTRHTSWDATRITGWFTPSPRTMGTALPLAKNWRRNSFRKHTSLAQSVHRVDCKMPKQQRRGSCQCLDATSTAYCVLACPANRVWNLNSVAGLDSRADLAGHCAPASIATGDSSFKRPAATYLVPRLRPEEGPGRECREDPGVVKHAAERATLLPKAVVKQCCQTRWCPFSRSS